MANPAHGCEQPLRRPDCGPGPDHGTRSARRRFGGPGAEHDRRRRGRGYRPLIPAARAAPAASYTRNGSWVLLAGKLVALADAVLLTRVDPSRCLPPGLVSSAKRHGSCGARHRRSPRQFADRTRRNPLLRPSQERPADRSRHAVEGRACFAGADPAADSSRYAGIIPSDRLMKRPFRGDLGLQGRKGDVRCRMRSPTRRKQVPPLTSR